MALLFCDGCDQYTVDADIIHKWDGQHLNTYNGTGGKFGQGCIAGDNRYAYSLLKNLSYAVSDTVPFNFGFWYKGTGSTGNTGFGNDNSQQNLQTSGGAWQVLGVTNGATFLQIRNDLNNAHGTTNGTHTVGGDAWHWIEVSILFHTTAGYVKVYVDGLADINYTGPTCNTVPTTINSIAPCGAWFNSTSQNIDDFIVWDGSGSAVNSFPLGPQRITTLVPTANGDVDGFTPSAGSNYACVNAGFDGTNYVSNSSTGVTDLYRFGTLSYNPLTINAVVGNYFAQNTGIGTAFLYPTIKTGTTTTTIGTIQLANGTTQNWQNAFVNDANGSAWVTSTVNTIQLGMTD